jgi:hypothetical protein
MITNCDQSVMLKVSSEYIWAFAELEAAEIKIAAANLQMNCLLVLLLMVPSPLLKKP